MYEFFDSPREPLVPIFQNIFRNENGDIKPIEIVEILDDERHVVEWRFLQDDIIKLNRGKNSFTVGELVLDYLNKAEEIRIAYNQGELAHSFNNNEIISKSSLERDNILDILINHKNDPDIIGDLYRNFRDIYKLYGSRIEIEPLWIGSFDKVNGTPLGNKYLVYGSLEFSFLFLDLYHVINNDKISFNRCKHCNHIFVKSKKNQIYCDRCRAENIPEKSRKKGNAAYILRQRIYSRLNKRDMSGHSREYIPGLKSHFDFSEMARKKWAELTEEQYLKWLQQIDALTK